MEVRIQPQHPGGPIRFCRRPHRVGRDMLRIRHCGVGLVVEGKRAVLPIFAKTGIVTCMRLCRRASARPTARSRRPASQPLASGGSDLTYRHTASTNSSSASFARTAGDSILPADSCCAAKRNELSIQSPEAPSSTPIFCILGKMSQIVAWQNGGDPRRLECRRIQILRRGGDFTGNLSGRT